mmetsp:Transcript_143645/g.459616  ORF Transcript_143645/g.459616 Transcript_143645/m.459616 type:complete len:81 (-) Transcript_143645:596-838(-)
MSDVCNKRWGFANPLKHLSAWCPNFVHYLCSSKRWQIWQSVSTARDQGKVEELPRYALALQSAIKDFGPVRYGQIIEVKS